MTAFVAIMKVVIAMIVPTGMRMILITVKTDFAVHGMSHNQRVLRQHVVLLVHHGAVMITLVTILVVHMYRPSSQQV
jgi:hypothetical protein